MFDTYKLSVNELRLLRKQLYYLHAEMTKYKRQMVSDELATINQQLHELTGEHKYLLK